LNVENFRIITKVDCFVLCFSAGRLDELIEAMCAPERLQYAYDGCVSINSPEGLAQAIFEEGVIDGTPVRDNFEVLLAPVWYGSSKNDFMGLGVTSANPFVKRPVYSGQQEVRIVLLPRGGG
jgi:hypothetical protein